jgi:hypothetical protein
VAALRRPAAAEGVAEAAAALRRLRLAPAP